VRVLACTLAHASVCVFALAYTIAHCPCAPRPTDPVPLGQIWPTGPIYSLYSPYMQPIYSLYTAAYARTFVFVCTLAEGSKRHSATDRCGMRHDVMSHAASVSRTVNRRVQTVTLRTCAI